MTVELQTGEKIGPYRVVRALGRGGMGAVYEVVHEQLGVHYALKTFTLEGGHVDLFRKRFLAEGKVLARIHHQNIVRVFDMDLIDNGALAYFVMDLVHYQDGQSYTLADLDAGGADEARLLEWFTQLASAIDYIHELGVVHRDIKLNNILIDNRGGVMLSDFGISKFTDEKIRSEVDVSRTHVTQDGDRKTGNLIIGTEGYMAPEILVGAAASEASDTYALGVTFFRLLTGMWYEPGSKGFQLLEPLDAPWIKILPRMLDPDPAKRPTHLAPLAAELTAGVGKPPTKKPRTVTALLIAGLVILVVGATVGGLFMRKDRAGESATEAVVLSEQKVIAPPAEGKIVLEVADGVSMTFVRCPAQTFAMSNVPGGTDGEGTHTVTLTRDFWVSQDCVPSNLLAKTTLDGINSGLADLNSRLANRLPQDTVLRLPTEAEWELAMRTGVFEPGYDFEPTADTVPGKYAKKYAWKAELDTLVYAEKEIDPYRTSVNNAAWVCRQRQFKRFLLRPDNGNVKIRLALGQKLR